MDEYYVSFNYTLTVKVSSLVPSTFSNRRKSFETGEHMLILIFKIENLGYLPDVFRYPDFCVLLISWIHALLRPTFPSS